MSENKVPVKGPNSKAPAGKADREAKSTPQVTGWRAYRQEITFLALFVVILAGSFTLISLNQVDQAVIRPFTAQIAKASAVVLDLMGQDIKRDGIIISIRHLEPEKQTYVTKAVEIENGCNGIEAMVIFLAAVLAFPASWKSRIIGLVLGSLAIQLVNLVRVVALVLTLAYKPEFFDSSHTVIWQTVVILCGVLLWIFWANRFAEPTPAATAS